MSSVAPTPDPPSQRETRPGLQVLANALLVLVAVLGVVGLGYTAVAGSMATSRRVGEPLRKAYAFESNIASAAGIDLAAMRRGRVEYMTTCTACHGPSGEALPNLGKDLAHSEFVAAQSASQLKMFLKLGRETWDPANTTGVAMPGKGGNPMITDDDLADISQFLFFLQAASKP